MKNKKELTERIGGINGFKVHTPRLLKEIADCGLIPNQGVLKVPLNVLRKYLISLSQRAAQLNDPILNKIMCDMALYEVSDQYSKEYNQDTINSIDKLAWAAIEKQKK